MKAIIEIEVMSENGELNHTELESAVQDMVQSRLVVAHHERKGYCSVTGRAKPLTIFINHRIE